VRIDLWRVVDPAELADIRRSGRFNASPTGSEGKYFWGSYEDAMQYAGYVDGIMG
jgi:hypothetical protein